MFIVFVWVEIVHWKFFCKVFVTQQSIGNPKNDNNVQLLQIKIAFEKCTIIFKKAVVVFSSTDATSLNLESFIL